MLLENYTPYTPILSTVEQGTDDEALTKVLPTQFQLEKVRKALYQYEKEGRYTNEISNAIISIEQALLHLDHYRLRREYLGIYSLPVPESVEKLVDTAMRLGECNVTISFEHDKNHNERTVISQCGLTKQYPQTLVPFLYSFMVWVNNNKQVNYILNDDEEHKTVLITVTTNNAHVDRAQYINDFLSYFDKKNKIVKDITDKDQYVNKLRITDLITDTQFTFDLPTYAIKHNASYNTRRAFTFYRTLTSKLNEAGIYLISNYEHIETMFCFNNTLSESRNVVEQLVSETTEEIANLNIV